MYQQGYPVERCKSPSDPSSHLPCLPTALPGPLALLEVGKERRSNRGLDSGFGKEGDGVGGRGGARGLGSGARRGGGGELIRRELVWTSLWVSFPV